MSQILINALEGKLKQGLKPMLVRSIWAGNFISLGCIFYTVSTSLSGPTTLLRLIGSMLFSIGLCLVIYFKSQLFTGNHLMFLNLLTKKTTIRLMLRNWTVVFFGNLLGSIIMLCLFCLIFKNTVLEERLITIAKIKTDYFFTTALYKAVHCNILVCLAVYLGVTCKKLIFKFIGILIPITLFVFLGFEHSIANMFFVPLGSSYYISNITDGVVLFLKNIIPVTFGNILGGFILSIMILKLRRQ